MKILMSNISTPEDVIDLPRSEKEMHHHSRKRQGYHVYLSYYFKLFNEMKIESKHRVMIANGVWQDEDDNMFIDSTMTPRLPL